MAVFIFNKYSSHGEDLRIIENQYTEEQIHVVKSRVDETVEYIDFHNSQIQKISEESLKKRMESDIKKKIIQWLDNMRFGKHRQNYFFLIQ